MGSVNIRSILPTSVGQYRPVYQPSLHAQIALGAVVALDFDGNGDQRACDRRDILPQTHRYFLAV